MTILKAFRLQGALAKKLALLAKISHRSETYYVEQALVHESVPLLKVRGSLKICPLLIDS